MRATHEQRDAIKAATQGRTPNSLGWVRIDCPCCPDVRRSFGFRPATGGFRCFRCGVNGRLRGDGYVLPEVADKADDGEEKPKVEIPYDDFFPLWVESAVRSETLRPAIDYLRGRGFQMSDIETADMHYAVGGRYAGRAILPHKDAFGDWWGSTSRLLFNPPKDGPPKTLYPANMDRGLMFNQHVLMFETAKPVMLVEGCLDAVWYLPHVVATLGKTTPAHFETLLEACRPVVVCLDGDAWEEGRALAMRLRLRGKEAAFVRLPPTEDPNSVNPNWLRREVQRVAPRREPCSNSNHSPSFPTSSEPHASPTTTPSTACASKA